MISFNSKVLISIIILLISAHLPIYGIKTIRKLNIHERSVLLTFDDGPHPIYTKKILNILKKYNIKATFFFKGDNIARYPRLVKRAQKEGHLLGSHTYHHKKLTSKKIHSFKQDLQHNKSIFKHLLHSDPIPYFRPPYGILPKNHIPLLKKYHFSYIIRWSIDTKDWDKKRDVIYLFNEIYKKAEPGSIILFHDTSERTAKSIETVIQILKRKSFSFITLEKLKNI